MLDEVYQRILAQTKAKRVGKGYLGHCPAHDDQQASLSIGLGRKGFIILHCHAGCSFHSVCDALSQTINSVEDTMKKAEMTPGEIVKKYDYRDANGALLYHTVRFNPKGFAAQKTDGSWGIGSTKRVPYRLPELLSAHKDAAIWIVEGEKDCDRLVELGLVATTNPFGAGKWATSFSEYVKDRDVIIIPDNDTPGRHHAYDVATKVYDKARSVRILHLPGLKEEGDVSDWLDAGHDESELATMSLAAPDWTPDSVDAALAAFKPGPRLILADNILTNKYPDPHWAVKGIIPEGTTIIAGPPKLGKSVFCLNIAVSVSEGMRALSYFEVEQGAVLYLALEDNERRIQQRLKKNLGQDARLSNHLEIATTWNKLNEGGLEDLEDWITKHGALARLIIVDTYKRIRPDRAAHHRNSSFYDVDYDDMSPLTDLTNRHHIALCLVAHTRKAEAEDPLETISGSNGLTGASDGALILERKRQSKNADLHVIGRDVEEQEIALEFNPERFTWSALGESSEVKQLSAREEIIDLLKKSRDTLAPGEIADALNRKSGTIRNLLFKMKNDNLISKIGKKYHLPEVVSKIELDREQQKMFKKG